LACGRPRREQLARPLLGELLLGGREEVAELVVAAGGAKPGPARAAAELGAAVALPGGEARAARAGGGAPGLAGRRRPLRGQALAGRADLGGRGGEARVEAELLAGE